MSDDGERYAEEVIRQVQGEVDARWERPLPLDSRHKLKPFPAHRFPPWLNEYVTEMAHQMQVPVDLPAMLALSVLAAAAGGRAVAVPREGWREPLNLYTAIAMSPGSRKTPVFQRMIAPLTAMERELVEEAKAEILDARIRLSVAKAQADKAEQEAQHAKPDAAEEARNHAKAMSQMAEAITVPYAPRLLADDATPEALVTMLFEQQGRLAMFSDEGEVFYMMAGRYSSGGGPNLGVYLKGHVGSPIRVDRKGREPEFIERPALTLGLTLQPDLLRQIAAIPSARGRGLLGRFLWAVPASNIGYREIGAAPIRDEVADAYARNVSLIVRSLAEWTDPALIVFDEGAGAALLVFEREIESLLPEEDGELGHISDWSSKLVGHVARIAALLHLATHITDGWAKPVDASVVADAIHIAKVTLIPHALQAFDVMDQIPVLVDARVVMGWVVRRSSFSRRDLFCAFQRRFQQATAVDPVIDLLTDYGIIKPRPQPKLTGGGRPPSPTYTVNPRLRQPPQNA